MATEEEQVIDIHEDFRERVKSLDRARRDGNGEPEHLRIPRPQVPPTQPSVSEDTSEDFRGRVRQADHS